MTPVMLCEYIVAATLGLCAAFFIVACFAALIKWLFIKPIVEYESDSVGARPRNAKAFTPSRKDTN